MHERTFQPAGAAIAAIVAGLAPGAQALAPVDQTSPRDALAEAVAKMKPATPFAAGQLELPFED